MPTGYTADLGPAVTNSTVWPAWNYQFVTTTGATSLVTPVPAQTVWANWNQQVFCTGTSATTGTVVVGVDFGGTGDTIVWGQWNTIYTGTREQREARERRETVDAQNFLRARESRARARDRAMELLGALLTPAQLASYRDNGWFEIRSNKGRRWRIRARGQSGNVDLMPETGDEREATYCAHPPGRLPDPDAHLAQMLSLVTDEDEFVRVANVHYLNPRRAVA